MKRAILVLAVMVSIPAYGGNCSWITTPTAITLGTYSVFGSGALVATSTYAFRCTPNTTATLTFTTGTNSSTYFPRYLASGANTLAYNVYDDAATSIVVGNNSGGTTSRVVFNSTSADKDYADTVYGKVVLGADVPPGTYTDSVTAVLSWGNGTVSSTLAVSTVVIAECTISAAALSFGSYDPVVTNAASPANSSSSINVFCTKTTSGTVWLGNGLYFSGGRRLRDATGTSFLNYQLFTDSGLATQWFSTAPGVVSGTSTSKLTAINNGMTVYGRIPANQDPLVGAYSDTVQATVNY